MFDEELLNVLLLLSLYLLQGIPLGLVSGSLPFMIKSRMTYSELAIFSLANYPFSLKFFWSPLVDSYSLSRVGRRKSWIIPMQVISGFLMIYLSYYIEDMVKDPGQIWTLTVYLFLIVLVFATQDIAVDSWGVEMLKESNRSMVSTCNSIGQSIGFFASYTLFLTLNSADFCNKYIFTVKQEQGLVSLPQYMFCCGVLNWLICLWVVAKQEKMIENSLSPKEIYVKVVQMVKEKNYQMLIFLLVSARIGTAVFDSALGLVLHEKGVKEEDLGLLAGLTFPFELVIGTVVGVLVNKINSDLDAMYLGMGLRVLSCIFGFFFVLYFPQTGLDSTLFVVLFALLLFSSFASNIYFIAMCSYFSKVSQGPMTATVYTFLTTASNFGASSCAFLAYKAIDFMTFEGNCERLCDGCEEVCENRVHGFYPVAWASLAICFFHLLGVRKVFAFLKGVEWRGGEEIRDKGVDRSLKQGKELGSENLPKKEN